MTGKDRTLRALRFEQPDRAPIMGGFLSHGPFMEKASGIRPWWSAPEECLRRVYHTLGVDAIGASMLPKRPEESATLSDGRISEFARKSDQPSRYHSPEDVLAFVRKQPPIESKIRQFDARKVYDEIKATCEQGQAQAGDERLWIPWRLHRDVSFHPWLSTFGYENFLAALALYEQEMERLFAEEAALSRLWNEVLVKCFTENDYPKVVWYGQDICGNRGPMASPALLRRIYFPHLKHAFEPLFEAKIKVVWHSDGNIKPIRQDLLDAGVGGFQGMQEFMDDPDLNNALEELAEMTDRHGDRLIIFGGISVRRTLVFGTPDDVRAAAQRCLDLSKSRGGGLVIFTDTSIGPDAPIANVFTLYEYVTGVKATRYPT
ncbi:MAG: hypothetical protein FJ279_17825 [Planctomycetes bacterium]|nr:hypothetical protein [Planctomycetota bacterium]